MIMESTTTEQVAGTDDVERVARAVRKNQFARIGRLSSYDPEIAPTENELDDVRAAIAALSPPAVPIVETLHRLIADMSDHLCDEGTDYSHDGLERMRKRVANALPLDLCPDWLKRFRNAESLGSEGDLT